LATAVLGVGGPMATETEPCAHAHAAAAEDRCKSEDCDNKEEPYAGTREKIVSELRVVGPR
jgi:hypothetical protein